MDRDDRTVQRHGFELHAEDLRLLQLGKDALQYPVFRPPVQARIDRVPVPELLGQTAPFAAVFGDVQDGIENLQVVERDVATLGRQASLDVPILSLGEFHGRSIAEPWSVVLTGPSSVKRVRGISPKS